MDPIRKRKIALISDARTSHGIYIPVLNSIKKNPNLEYLYIITGMHLSQKFGNTIDIIKKEGFETIEMKIPLDENEKNDQVKFIGKAINALVEIFENEKPDIILAQGDRGITLAGAIAGAYMKIPVAHMHGGEISSTIDESVRHTITKLSHIHFPSTKKSSERILKMGEDEFRIHLVGATGIDLIVNKPLILKGDIVKKFEFDSEKPLVVILYHPENNGKDRENMENILKSIVELKEQTIIIYPNNDPGHDEIIEVIKKYENKYKEDFFIKSYKNLPYEEYLSLLKISSVLIGNSSGALIETPSLGVPVVNVGIRQRNREKALNVIDVGSTKEEISSAISKSLNDKNYLEIVRKCKTPYDPYGTANAGERIADILSKIEINDKLIAKQISY